MLKLVTRKGQLLIVSKLYTMYRIFINTIFLFLLCHLSVHGQATYDKEKVATTLDDYFSYCYEHELFNGQVMIFDQDEIIYEASFGNISGNSQNQISPHTSFLLASLSKQFTAMAIVQLQSEGKLNYDDAVIDYLDDFPYPNVTIRHLLNHTSGILEYTDVVDSQFEMFQARYESSGALLDNKTISSMYAKKKPPLNFTPGSDFDYSNTGYVYLANIIEAVSQLSYSEYLAKAFFAPLHMNDTWVRGSLSSSKAKKATGYKANFLNKDLQTNETPAFFTVYGDGGVYSSASDLRKWFVAINKGEVIEEKALEEVYKLPKMDEKTMPYGFGWFVRKLPFNDHRALTHSGQFVGFTNSIFRDLDDDVTAIVLSNNSHKINKEINQSVVRVLYGVPHKSPKISASISLGKMIVEKDIAVAQGFYNLNKENEHYDFSENSLNRLGYELLRAEYVQKAIDVFTWNVTLHPESSNVYDSLGEAYVAIRDRENALLNYRMAYKLDPTNANAKVVIEKLEGK